MNIFVLENTHDQNVKSYVDKHVIKMILETAQLLCTTHHQLGSAQEWMYRQTHVNHPCAIWVRKSLDNYKWLVELGLELCKEYTYRFGKVHKTTSILLQLKHTLPNIESKGLTSFALCMPDEYKVLINQGVINFVHGNSENQNLESTVESYRNYYIGEKTELFKWTKRDQPKWIKNFDWEIDDTSKLDTIVLDNIDFEPKSKPDLKKIGMIGVFPIHAQSATVQINGKEVGTINNVKLDTLKNKLIGTDGTDCRNKYEKELNKELKLERKLKHRRSKLLAKRAWIIDRRAMLNHRKNSKLKINEVN